MKNKLLDCSFDISPTTYILLGETTSAICTRMAEPLRGSGAKPCERGTAEGGATPGVRPCCAGHCRPDAEEWRQFSRTTRSHHHKPRGRPKKTLPARPYRRTRHAKTWNSRITNIARPNSDIDLVLYGSLDEATVNRIWTLFDSCTASG